ncbi:hypothetical protein MNL92_18400 [Acinetobacter baumannii]|nr:hypothetical protein [Acinetobacter baumannii]
MSKVLNELPASASNNESLILQALNASNQRQVAEMINVDASILSRMKTEKKSNGWTEIEFISFLLTAIGLKVVQESDVYCSPEIAEATRKSNDLFEVKNKTLTRLWTIKSENHLILVSSKEIRTATVAELNAKRRLTSAEQALAEVS